MLQNVISDSTSGVFLDELLIKTEMIYKHKRLMNSQLEEILSCLTTRPLLTDKLKSNMNPWDDSKS